MPLASISVRAPIGLRQRHAQRQTRAINRGDTIALAVDRAVGKLWSELMRVLDAPDAAERVKQIMRRLNAVVREAIGARLLLVAKTVHDGIRGDLLGSLQFKRKVTEDINDDPALWLDMLRRFFPQVASYIPDEPTALPLVLSGQERLGKLFQQYVLPALSGPDALRIILAPTDGVTWVDRIARITALAPPETVAAMVLHSTAAGESRVEMARRLQPILQGVKSSAMRVARTEGARVANQSAWEAHEQLAPLIDGYEVSGVRDANSRPWHLARHGVVYYREPANGQKGFDSMPKPPFEPPNMDGLPTGEPRLAFNCRCFLSPHFRTVDHEGEETSESVGFIIQRIGNEFRSIFG